MNFFYSCNSAKRERENNDWRFLRISNDVSAYTQTQKKRQRKRENAVRDSPMDNYHYQDKRTIDMLSSIDTARALSYTVSFSRLKLLSPDVACLDETLPLSRPEIHVTCHKTYVRMKPTSILRDRETKPIYSLSSTWWTSRIDHEFLESIHLTS